MTIKDFKDLEQLLKLCNKQGVRSVEIDGIKLQLTGDIPEPTNAKKLKTEEPQASIDQYTEEQIALWSVNTGA